MSVSPTASGPSALPNMIAGEAVSADDLETLVVLNPSTGDELAKVPLSGAAEVDRAVEAAASAGREWAAVSVVKRARVMFRAQNLMTEATDELAELVATENGKALSDARAEIVRGLEVLEFAAGMPTLIQGVTSTGIGSGVDAETRAYPVGVVAGITPFNFPGMIPMWMMPIALAAGNSFVLKPSEQTPLTAMRLAELFREAGLPDGVLNVVHGGRDAVDALLVHPKVAAVSFVGSAPVARHVYETAAAAGKRVQALAGAKNFLIALDDAPLEASADAIFSSAFGNAGQRCLAGSVLCSTPGIRENLLAALQERIAAAPQGPGTDPDAVITPVINPGSKQRILGSIQEAMNAGAKIVVGGEIKGGAEDCFLRPTIIGDVDPSMKLMDEELFGPVLADLPVDGLPQAIEIANASRFGNSASIFTDSGHAARLFRETIEAGMLGINVGVPAPIGYLPFSGWKGSFFGDLHANGTDGVRFYTKLKAITTRWPED
jgi:malonate-semialdehyde dehydrogenase (acetylating) / methylmalonate-semialdehyde dehydrogenase